MKRKIIIYIIIGIMFWPVAVYGEDSGETPADSSYYNYSGITEITEEEDFDFEKTVNDFIKGDTESALTHVGKSILSIVFSELSMQKSVIIKILSIGILAALFSNIAGAFASGSISDTGFYLAFTALLGVLVAGYSIAANMILEALNKLIELMEAIVPVYILSLGFASGQTTATGFYQVTALAITFVEKIIQTVIIPLIYIYMVTGLMNNIVNGNFLVKAGELIKGGINWILKALLSVIIGMNVIQGMINPVVDSLKTSSLGKAASLIPGIGGALNSMSGIILGSGTLIKNSIGMASMVAIIVVSFSPVIKAVIMSAAYKAAGAVMEPVSDKRAVNSVSVICDSIGLLSKTLLYAVVFFLLTVAIVCSTTNHNIS
ncbi:MAG: stage III sporulation protein AE [Butyrivibrio sp.]